MKKTEPATSISNPANARPDHGQSRDAFFLLDRNGILLHANPGDVFDQNSPNTFRPGQVLWTVLPPPCGEFLRSTCNAALESGQPTRVEKFYAERKAWFEIAVYPALETLCLCIRNITASRLQEQRLAFAAKATSEVIWERPVDSDDVYINGEKLEALFGYRIAHNRIHRSFWLERVHPDDLAAVHSRRTEALRMGCETYENEYRFRRGDGTWAYVIDRTWVVKDPLNNPVVFIGAMKDVSEKRAALTALEESEERYRQLFYKNPLCKLVFDKETLQILEANDTALEHFGYTRDEVLAMTVLDFKPPADHATTVETIGRFMGVDQNEVGVYNYLKKNGETTFCSVSIRQVCYKGHDAVLASLKDVTGYVLLQQQMEQERRQQQKAILQANLEGQERERNAIAAELHDNVNQIISSAKLYVENILHAPGQTEAMVTKSSELLQLAIDETRQLCHHLVTPPLHRESFTQSLLTLVQSFRELNCFGVDSRLQVDEDKLAPELRLNVFRIYQELFNNTLKYAGAKRISVSVISTDRALQCTYGDDGNGFDPARVKRGLGLYNLQSRVEAYGGRLTIWSEPGRGFRATMTIPF